MTHEIKLKLDFVDAVNSGQKSFEVRKNDRGYQTGDLIRFLPLDEDGDLMEDHPLHKKLFRITYLLSGWGIEKDYVVFSIAEVRDADSGNT